MSEEKGFNFGNAPDTSAGVPELPFVPEVQGTSGLASLIMRTFIENSDHRRTSGVDDKLLSAQLAYLGEYSEEDKARFRRANIPDDVFTPLTATKCRSAESQFHEIYNAPGDKTWEVHPTPVPDVPESVKVEAANQIIQEFQEYVEATGRMPTEKEVRDYTEGRMDEVRKRESEWAQQRAERMDRVVHDQMVEGGFIEAFSQYIDNLVEYGTAAIRGPIPRTLLRTSLKETKYGSYKYEIEDKEVLCYESISPWDLFPAPGAKAVTDGNLCVRVRFTPNDLWQFCQNASGELDKDGDWFADTVKAILDRWPNGGLRLSPQPHDVVREYLQNDGFDNGDKCTMEGVEFYGKVRGSLLREIGVLKTSDGNEVVRQDFYEIDAVCMDGYVVYCRIVSPKIGRPISRGVFYALPDSWWGDSIANRCRTAQRVVNAALRSLCNNMAMASGPMVYVKDFSRLHDKSANATKIEPWKVVGFDSGTSYGQTDVPIGVITFPTMVNELVEMFKFAKTMADEDTGIPAYSYGTGSGGGALRTASGLAQLTEMSNRIMKMAIIATDRDVVRDLVRRTVSWNLVYSDDMSIKGDVDVDPSGTMGQIMREQESTNRKQILSLLANPSIMQIVGPKLLVEVLRLECGRLGLKNLDAVLPSKERMDMMEKLQEVQQMQQAMAPAIGGGEEAAAEEAGAEEGNADVFGLPDAGASANPQADAAAARIQENPGEVAMVHGLPSTPGGVRDRRNAA